MTRTGVKSTLTLILFLLLFCFSFAYASETPEQVAKKLEDITTKQKDSIEKSENAMQAVENRFGLTTFLIGSNLGILKFQVVQMEDENSALEALYTTDQAGIDKTEVSKDMTLLSKEIKKVNEFILEHSNKFSLFGWFVTLL